MQFWRVAAATAALMLAGAASARADTRYVSAAGTGDCSSEAAACDFTTVRGLVQDGDVLRLAPGDYAITGDVVFDKAVTLEGVRGARPVLSLRSLELGVPGSVLRDVTVRGYRKEYVLRLAGSTAERVDVSSDNADTEVVCDLDGPDSRLSNSACSATGPSGANAIALNRFRLTTPRTGDAVLDHVTAVSPATALIADEYTTAATVTDSILLGGEDIVANGNARVQVSSSRIGSWRGQVTLGAGNTGALLALDAARPGAGAPTIDAGASGAGFDLAGNPRSLGPAPDMGAYEWVPTAPVVWTGEVTTVSQTGAIVPASIDARGDATAFRVEYGPTAAYGAAADGGPVGAGTLARDVLASLGGLAPGTTYHYRVVAANAYGTTVGEDHAFTTAPLAPTPVVAGLPKVSPKVTVSLASNKRCRATRTQTLRVKIASGGTITRVEVYVNKKRKLRVTKAKDLKKAIKVSKLPRGTYTLEVRVTTKDGRTVKSSRKYRTCSSSR